MENANAPALLAGETPAPPPEPSPARGRPLTVAYDRRAVLRQHALTLGVTVAGAVVP